MLPGIRSDDHQPAEHTAGSFLLNPPKAEDVIPGGGLGLGAYRIRERPPLLEGDRADPAGVSSEFEAGENRRILSPVDDNAVDDIYQTQSSDLRNQQFGPSESLAWDSVFPRSGSAALGSNGGLLNDSGAGQLQQRTSLEGPLNHLPADIGNPRTGAPGPLGTMGVGDADSEASLRAQILEAIKTDPATRLDQGVAIPALYQQVNPQAKLGFPELTTRPQFQEDFVRGRMGLPKSLRINEQDAMIAPHSAYSHVNTLDALKDVYSGVYGGNPPSIPTTMATGSKAGMHATMDTPETKPLPGFYDMYPVLADPGHGSSNNTEQHVTAPPAGAIPPLMAGDPPPVQQPGAGGHGQNEGSAQWPINTAGYAVDDAPRSESPRGPSTETQFGGDGGKQDIQFGGSGHGLQDTPFFGGDKGQRDRGQFGGDGGKQGIQFGGDKGQRDRGPGSAVPRPNPADSWGSTEDLRVGDVFRKPNFKTNKLERW